MKKKYAATVQWLEKSIFKPQFVMFSTIYFGNGFDSVILFSNDFKISRGHIITL